MNSFGASAPGEILYNNFGLNAKEIVKLALRIYKKNNGYYSNKWIWKNW